MTCHASRFGSAEGALVFRRAIARGDRRAPFFDPAPHGSARFGPPNLYSARAIRSRRLPVKTLLFLARRRRAAALAALAALGLTACGRYGPLEPPPDASAAAKPAAPAAPATGADALSPQLKPKIPPITAPNQPFILDPLLK